MSGIVVKRLPCGWDINLYDYLVNAPLKSWFWEFYRRAMLLYADEHDAEIHAYNQESLFDETNNKLLVEESRLFNYFDEDLFPYFLNAENYVKVYGGIEIPPAVLFTNNVEMKYSQSPLISFDQIYEEIPTLEINVDFTRKDSSIVKDFKKLLALWRKEFPRPSRKTPNLSAWYSSKCLPVWDLRNENVTWGCISKELFGDKNYHEPARNAYKTAAKYINLKKIYELFSSL